MHGELSASAWMHTDAGGPVLMTYDAAHPDIAGDEDLVAAFGLGDGGTVDVLLERAGAPGHVDLLELAARCAELQRRAAVATVIASYGSAVRVGTRVALLATGEIESIEVDISELNSGLYILVLNTIDNSYHTKFIKR